MTTYESEKRILFANAETAFGLLSDLSNLEKFKHEENAPEQLKEAQFDKDSCQIKVEGLGTIGLRVVERIPFSTIKFETENIPMMKFDAWVLLEEINENETQLQLKLEANLPMMVKMMLDAKIKDGINKAADVIAKAINSR